MKKILLIVFVLFGTIGYSQNLWFTERLDLKVDDKWKVKVEYEDRTSNFHLDYEHFDVGLTNKTTENLSININNRFIHEFDTLMKTELRPHFSVDYKLWRFGIKPRLEIRMRPTEEISARFRGRLYFKQKIKGNFYFYTENEIFVTTDLNRNRYLSGIIIEYKVIDLLIYYLLESKKKEEWNSEHIFGTSLRFSL